VHLQLFGPVQEYLHLIPSVCKQHNRFKKVDQRRLHEIMSNKIRYRCDKIQVSISVVGLGLERNGNGVAIGI
jgi:hypothetical protein